MRHKTRLTNTEAIELLGAIAGLSFAWQFPECRADHMHAIVRLHYKDGFIDHEETLFTSPTAAGCLMQMFPELRYHTNLDGPRWKARNYRKREYHEPTS